MAFMLMIRGGYGRLRGRALWFGTHKGKLLGCLMGCFFRGYGGVPDCEFCVGGDRLVVLALQRLWVVRLGEMVVSEERCDAVGC